MSQPKILSIHDFEYPVITQKQEQILQGAMQVFLRSGYASTSMDRVAAEAGVSKQTIYTHFRDKEGLFKALMERMTICHFREMFASEPLVGEPEIMLRRIAETYLTEVVNQEYLALIRLIVAESVRFPELAKLFTLTVARRGRALLSAYFESQTHLKIADPEAIAQIFFGSLVSYVLLQEIMHGKETMPMERDRLVDNLIHLVLARR